jgi:hypothetical protein
MLLGPIASVVPKPAATGHLAKSSNFNGLPRSRGAGTYIATDLSSLAETHKSKGETCLGRFER